MTVMPIRLMALVGEEIPAQETRHVRGASGDGEEVMSWPDVVLLQADAAQGTMLYRYTSSGAFCGDTWHETVAAAKHQAEFEYGAALGAWVAVPDQIENAHDYAIRIAAAAGRGA